MASETTQKFRPAFTKQEILYLIDLCSKDKRDTTTELAFTLAARLRIFALKADLGIISPAFTSTERQTLSEKLGLSNSESPADRRAAAYAKWKENPGFCTQSEVSLAFTYRYENGLMTPEQEAAYEKS